MRDKQVVGAFADADTSTFPTVFAMAVAIVDESLGSVFVRTGEDAAPPPVVLVRWTSSVSSEASSLEVLRDPRLERCVLLMVGTSCAS